MQKRVWIIDDEQSICWALKRALSQSGYAVETFSNAEDAIALLPASPQLDAVLLDMRLPGMDGFAATSSIKKQRPKVPVIMMTAFGDLSSAIQAMELDIFEYLTKPFDLADGLKAVAKAIAPSATYPLSTGTNTDPITNVTLLGSSPAMQHVYKQVAIASRSDIPVLICGPSGFEMESVASAIHRNGQRPSSPFMVFAPIAIAPIALSTQLLGSAQTQNNTGGDPFLRSGAFELAGDGTLYIDEVSDLTLSLQAQLLRALEQKKYNRLGDAKALTCSARIIASTSRNLRMMVADGDFLEELRQKLSVFTVELTSLSERREDLLPIANAILKSHSQNRQLTFSNSASEWLMSRAWPGNLRELRNAIDHAVSTTRSNCIDVEDFSATDRSASLLSKEVDDGVVEAVGRWTMGHLDRLSKLGLRLNGTQEEELFGTMYDDFLAMVEPPLLNAMMDACNRNRALIAAQLGMHRSTLRQKMRRYEID